LVIIRAGLAVIILKKDEIPAEIFIGNLHIKARFHAVELYVIAGLSR
jgi:hypothetical protein